MGSFAEVEKVYSLFSDLPCEWFICGGWAIDLFLGRVTREHKDIDIAIARRDQLTVRDYLQQRGWVLEKACEGRLIPWAADEWIGLPLHGIWCRNENHDPNFIELLLNEIDDEFFRFRRDRSMVVEREQMFFRTREGFPVLAPEIVLLYKSNSPEEYNSDFQNAASALSERQRIWLKTGLEKIFPKHIWIDRL